MWAPQRDGVVQDGTVVWYKLGIACGEATLRQFPQTKLLILLVF